MQKSLKEKNSPPLYGLVISYFGNSVAVEGEAGQVVQCYLRRNQELPVVGDKVEWSFESENSGIILNIEPRSSLLKKGDGKGDSRPIAANVDAIAIVMSPPPVFSEYLIDRYLTAAELLNIQPLIVVNKMDLLDEIARDAVLNRLKIYQAIPYPLILSSIFSKEGLSGLSTYLKHKTAVLVGPSGVGKSSIIAALVKEQMIRIGEVSAKGAGKHTTTATRLYHLPDNGGNLIDSPGVREFNLWTMSKEDVLLGFKEFQAFLGHCKFRNCLHVIEPGCAVQEAVLHDKISSKRYESYQALMEISNKIKFLPKNKGKKNDRK